MKKVLVVDDAMTIRKYHRKVMEDIGFEVGEAENGVEALEKGLTEPYDLFLVDINMPKMDGYRLISEMRRSPDLQKVPVIMVSTESEDGDQSKAYESGANYYMVKPSKPDDLHRYVTLMVGEAV